MTDAPTRHSSIADGGVQLNGNTTGDCDVDAPDVATAMTRAFPVILEREVASIGDLDPNIGFYCEQPGIIVPGGGRSGHHSLGEPPVNRQPNQTEPNSPPSTGASSRMAEDDYWDTLPVTLKSRDLERLLQIGQTTVSLWLTRGTIPGHQIAHSWIVFRSEVREWIESTSTVPLPEHEPYPHPLDNYAEYLNYQDLMVLLGKSRPAIFGWLNDGTIPAMRPGGRWRVEKKALHRLLEETSNQRPGFVPRSRRVADRNDAANDAP